MSVSLLKKMRPFLVSLVIVPALMSAPEDAATRTPGLVLANRIRPFTGGAGGTTTMVGKVALRHNLNVAGVVKAPSILTTDATLGSAVLIKTDGTLGVAAVPSTVKCKENIADMGSLSKKIMDLNPITFTYKNDPTQEVQVGLLAEQVEKTFPGYGLVERSEEGKPTAIRYHMLTPLLLNECQQQQKQIQELMDRVSKLEHKK